MKRVRYLLVGPAAGLALAAGALAADFPAKPAPAAVEDVRTCSVYGSGYFYVPGTNTCLQVSGYARAEYSYREPLDRAQDATGFFVRGRVVLDTRTLTEYGTIRSLVRTEINRLSGSEIGIAEAPSDGPTTTVNLKTAIVQFEGLTAGRAQSFFDFYANDNNFGSLFGSDRGTQQLAYTTTFADGFAATVSLEDPIERRTALTATPVGAAAFTALGPAGTRVPDVVGALRVDQTWGSAQLSAALHQNRVVAFPSVTSPLTPAVLAGTLPDTAYGFAVQGGVRVNTPFITPGDAVYLQAAYGRGALDYVVGGFNSALGTSRNTNASLGEAISLPATDTLVDLAGNLRQTSAFSLTGDILHYWVPQLRQNLFGSYARVDFPGGASTITPTVAGLASSGFVDFDAWSVGSNLIWAPVRSLEFGIEVQYTRLDPRGQVNVGTTAGPRLVSSQDVWQGRLRIQRDF